MRIAVLADTHGKFPSRSAQAMAEADEIWHLGDYCDLATLESVRAVGPPFTGVLGNNDWGLDLPRRLVLERAGRTFFLIHIPPARPGGADFLLHGHTHVPRDEMVHQEGGRGPSPSTRVLNPGSIGRADKGAPASWAWLEIDEKTGRVTWTLVPALR